MRRLAARVDLYVNDGILGSFVDGYEDWFSKLRTMKQLYGFKHD